MEQMAAAFTTQRLRVFETTVKPYDDRGTQKVFLAYLLTWNTSQPVVYATVSDNRTSGGSFPLYCEWLQAAPPYLRGGYSKELFLGIEGHLGGQMAAIASTPEGAAFLTALGRPVDSLAPILNEMFSPIINTPIFQARLQEEVQRIAQIPAEQNPLNAAVTSDRMDDLMNVAPLHLMNYLMTATDVTVMDRIQMIQRLAQSLGWIQQ